MKSRTNCQYLLIIILKQVIMNLQQNALMTVEDMEYKGLIQIS
jgi:hypothetical protein